MSASFVTSAVDAARIEIMRRIVIKDLVRDMTSQVEQRAADGRLKELHNELHMAMLVIKQLSSNIQSLKSANITLKDQADYLKGKAERVRDLFVTDMSALLVDSRRSAHFKQQISALKAQIREQRTAIKAMQIREEEEKSELQQQLFAAQREKEASSQQFQASLRDMQEQMQRMLMQGRSDAQLLSLSPAAAAADAACGVGATAAAGSAGENAEATGRLKTVANVDLLLSSGGELHAGALSDASGVSNGLAGAGAGASGDGDSSSASLPFGTANAPPVEEPSTSPASPLVPAPVVVDVDILGDIEDIELLHIFSFLETVEVLTCAQVNRFVFQRVDVLFGIDSKVARPSWAVRMTKAEIAAAATEAAEAAAEAAAAAAAAAQLPSSQSVDAKKQEIAGTGAAGGAGAAGKSASGTDASAARGAATDSGSTEAAASGGGGGGVSGFLSSFTSSIANSIRPAVLDEIDPATGLLPKGVLDLLRAKLSNAEMAAVEHLNACAAEQIALQQRKQEESDDVQARLVSAESVRDFLVAKLKEAETALKGALKDAHRLRKQSLADAEVISFLDLRSQEYEGKASALDFSLQSLQATVDLQRESYVQTDKQQRQELAALQSRLEESDGSHKAAKKLLVKEVKALRTAMESITTERDVLRAQVRAVMDSLRINGSSGSGKRIGNAPLTATAELSGASSTAAIDKPAHKKADKHTANKK